MNAVKKAVKKVTATSSAPKAATDKAQAPAKKAAAPAKAVAPVAKATPAKAAPAKAAPAKAPVQVPAVKVSAKETEKAAVKTSAKTVVKAPAKTSAKAAKEDAHSFSPEYLVLMQKDPNWMHAFWDVSERRVQDAVKGGSKLVLRLYDVTSDLTVRANKLRTFRDIEVPANARSWYIQNHGVGGVVNVVLGTIGETGSFDPIVNSDHVQAFGPEGQLLGSSDDLFLRASLGGAQLTGFGSSAQMLPGVSSGSFLFAPSSEAFSSQSYSSASFLKESGGASDSVNPGKDFFLWVKTRLIVYGGTRPDAHLQVRGQPFPLNPDGTFSLEMDLPDSTQIIPVFATDRDGDFPTTIVPIVVKRTE